MRVPALETTGIRKFYNGPESFTPGQPVPARRGAGAARLLRRRRASTPSASRRPAAPGRALAEWIVEGEPTSDLVGVDVRRFAPLRRGQRLAALAGGRGARAALRDPVAAARAGDRARRAAPRRCTSGSPRHGALVSARGWAGSGRSYFVPARGRLDAEAADRTGTKPAWLPWSAAEQRATPRRRSRSSTRRRSRSTSSPGPARSRRCSGSARPTSTCRSTTASTRRSSTRGHLRGRPHGHPGRRGRVPGWSAARRRPSATWTGSGGTRRPGRATPQRRGPSPTRSRARRDGAALARAAGGAHRRRPVEDGLPVRDQPGGHRSAGAPVRATRMTYVGELGWELMVPVEHALGGVRRPARGRAPRSGVRDAGYHAIESLRLEKGFRAFGRELTPDYTPVEAGLVFATALKRRQGLPGPGGARGAPRRAGRRRAAAPAGVDGGRRRRAHALGRRAAAAATARPVGQVTSAAWGETVGLVRRARPTSATTAR